MLPASGDQKKAGMIYRFKMDDFLKSMPHENVQYVRMLQQTQGSSGSSIVVYFSNLL